MKISLADHRMLVLLILGVLFSSTAIAPRTEEERRKDEYCMKGTYHKVEPGPEESLFDKCAPWKNNSCCNLSTSVEANNLNLYNFNYSHCMEYGKPGLSPRCRDYFVLDLCFFECSPDVGFWVVRDNHQSRKERMKKVPLCASECDAWFEACKDDFTCTTNWAHTFHWSNHTNKCLLGTDCRTFSELFKTAKNFCENIWDDSWKYTDDSMPCMNLTFDENAPNPNIRVAQFYSQTKCSASRLFIPYLLLFLLVLIVSLSSLMYYRT